MTAVGTAFMGGLVVTVVLLVVVPSSAVGTSLALGAASGVLMALALSAMWHSMAVSSAAIASPVVAAATALGPLAYGLGIGERPSAVAAAGIAVTIAGLQRGPLSEVAVAASLYPVVTIALAVLFDDDTLRWWQVIGIAAALSGTSMIALG